MIRILSKQTIATILLLTLLFWQEPPAVLVRARPVGLEVEARWGIVREHGSRGVAGRHALNGGIRAQGKKIIMKYLMNKGIMVEARGGRGT